MNNQDRKELDRARSLLSEAATIVEDIASGELEKYDNLPENLQYTAQGDQLNENSDALENINSEIEDVISNLEEVEGS